MWVLLLDEHKSLLCVYALFSFHRTQATSSLSLCLQQARFHGDVNAYVASENQA